MRGATTSHRGPMPHVFLISATTPKKGRLSSSSAVSVMDWTIPQSIVAAGDNHVSQIRSGILRISSKRQQVPPPKRAFALEDIIRKNSNAPSNITHQCIVGSQICPLHPSFSNLSRVAEVTLTRLLNSIGETTQASPPVSVSQLVQYCTLFRKKYPTIFASPQKVQKPAMPQPRQNLYSQQQKPVQAPQPVRQVVEPPPVVQQAPPPPPPAPPAPLQIQTTPTTPTADQMAQLGAAAAMGPSASWIRPAAQQQRRRPATRQDTPDIESGDNDTPMAAGGPTLYGQARTRQPSSRYQ
jgi:hypothetical protein